MTPDAVHMALVTEQENNRKLRVHIEELEAQLSAMTAERDHWKRWASIESGTTKNMFARAAVAEAAIPAAYRLGLAEAGGKAYYAECGEPTVSWRASPEHGFERGFQSATEDIYAAIRTLPIPTADALMARIAGETGHD